MLQLLVKFVFFLISSLATIILQPIFALITTLIPDTTNVINSIISYITTGLTCVPFILKLLMVPLEAVSFFFSFWVLVFGVSMTVRAIVFIKNAYGQYKP